MADLAKNFQQQDVGQPSTSEQLAAQIAGQANVAASQWPHTATGFGQVGEVVLGGATPLIHNDNVNADNQTQAYLTTNISTTAEPAYGVG